MKKNELIALVSGIQKSIDELQAQVQVLTAVINDLDVKSELIGNKLEASANSNWNQPKITSGHPIAYGEGLKQMAMNCIVQNKRFLHINEIWQDIHQRFENVSPSKVKTDLSINLSLMREEGKIFRYHAGRGIKNSFWGLKEWLDEDEKPRQEYKYNPNFLASNHPEHPGIDLGD